MDQPKGPPLGAVVLGALQDRQARDVAALELLDQIRLVLEQLLARVESLDDRLEEHVERTRK